MYELRDLETVTAEFAEADPTERTEIAANVSDQLERGMYTIECVEAMLEALVFAKVGCRRLHK